MKKEDKKLLYAGGIAGFIGALCCIGPVIIVLFGLGSLSTALSIGKYSTIFITLALIFFIAAILLYLKRKKCCNTKGIKQHWQPILIGFIILAVLLLLLKYWIAPLLAQIIY